jgi:Ca-activated chloride channel family protein
VRRIADLVDRIRMTGRHEPELVDEIVRLSTRFGIMTEYTSFLADERTDHGRLADNRLRAAEVLRRAGEDASAADGAGFALGANQAERRAAEKAPPPTSPAPAATPGESAAPAGATAGGGVLWKAKEGKRDVDRLEVGEVRHVANRAFYKRAGVQNKAQAWVDAEVTDVARADEVVARWSPRFFELLATTTPDENARLAQDGDVLLRIGTRQVFVTDAGEVK